MYCLCTENNEVGGVMIGSIKRLNKLCAGSGKIGAKCVYIHVCTCIHRILIIFFGERAGAVTSTRLTLSFHSAIIIAFAGIQPNIVMPMKLLLSLMFECRGSTGQF